MKATYTLEGRMTITDIIKFLREIQIERTGEHVLAIAAETTDGGATNFGGTQVVTPSHILNLTVEDE